MPTDSDVKCQSCREHHPTFKCRKSTRACFRCGNKDHFVKDCPMIPKPDSNSRLGFSLYPTRSSQVQSIFLDYLHKYYLILDLHIHLSCLSLQLL
ncbi:hypothetical protein AXF42_Ash007862 [Apostasia shenzhenica]|uniref:CCHC-type domain-containing protein n=1 Tax=Apostasia shenzhenica TaxID=1088818 RepID=A0A2I0B5J2_9ASPA|nr:hypothetical protein AXF42_Ash007862 [Apostasia shenzhenica]